MTTIKFENLGLSDELLQAIKHCGYTTCTKPQSQAIPALLKPTDALIQSETGSGKTATFCIPLIQKIDFNDSTNAIIITPTRELAQQIQEEFNRLATFKKLHCVLCIGREDFNKQKNQLKQKAHVIVGTCGRIIEHLQNDNIDLRQFNTLILDEAMEMFSMGLLDQTVKIHKMLPKHNTWLFSATLDTQESFDYFKLNNPIRIEIDHHQQIKKAIDCYRIETEDKQKTLITLLNNYPIQSCIIFVERREETDKLQQILDDYGIYCDCIHGGMQQKERFKIMKRFKEGELRCLVATDIIARGLDVSGISLIVHYTLPTSQDNYIHKSGRGARVNETSVSIVLMHPSEKSSMLEFLMETTTPFTIPTKKANNDFYESIHKESKTKAFEHLKTTLWISGGKKDKIRRIDIVGSLCNNLNINAEGIGIIDIQDDYSTVVLLNQANLKSIKSMLIKGKKWKCEPKRS